MNDLDTRDPLAALLHDALARDAEQAPQLPVEWAPLALTAASAHTNRRAIVVGVAASALVATSLAFVVQLRGSDLGPATPPSWRPAGEEFPSTDLGPATEVWDGPVVEDLTRQVAVEGHPPQVITRSLSYFGHDTAREQACTWENGSGGCRHIDIPVGWSNSITSSVDNKVADYDLWTVEGLPPETAFVTYVDGDTALWQRPIAGFAAFPNVPGSNEIVTAYDAEGIELGRFDSSTYFKLNDVILETAPEQNDGVTPSQFGELHEISRTELAECLTARDGTIGEGGVATFPANVDQVVVWSECVDLVQTIVAQRVAALSAPAPGA